MYRPLAKNNSHTPTKRPAFFLAAENLLRQLLIEMKPGAALLVLDLWKKSVDEVAALIETVTAEEAEEAEGNEKGVGEGGGGSNVSFTILRLGSQRCELLLLLLLLLLLPVAASFSLLS
jgi:anthranilate phosphoribosyltransferase